LIHAQIDRAFSSDARIEMTSQRQHKFAAERARMSEHSIPELIDLLSSANLRTRFIAEMCLRDATST